MRRTGAIALAAALLLPAMQSPAGAETRNYRRPAQSNTEAVIGIGVRWNKVCQSTGVPRRHPRSTAGQRLCLRPDRQGDAAVDADRRIAPLLEYTNAGSADCLPLTPRLRRRGHCRLHAEVPARRAGLSGSNQRSEFQRAACDAGHRIPSSAKRTHSGVRGAGVVNTTVVIVCLPWRAPAHRRTHLLNALVTKTFLLSRRKGP